MTQGINARADRPAQDADDGGGKRRIAIRPGAPNPGRLAPARGRLAGRRFPLYRRGGLPCATCLGGDGGNQ
jgi:hypothetical protein